MVSLLSPRHKTRMLPVPPALVSAGTVGSILMSSKLLEAKVARQRAELQEFLVQTLPAPPPTDRQVVQPAHCGSRQPSASKFFSVYVCSRGPPAVDSESLC